MVICYMMQTQDKEWTYRTLGMQAIQELMTGSDRKNHLNHQVGMC